MSHEGNMHEVVIDIETYADITQDQLERMAADIQAPKNWKDPEKIAAYVEKAKADLVSKAALSPRTGKIVCVGMCIRNVGESGAEWKPWMLATSDERNLLNMVDVVLDGCAVTRIITYNGKRFDLPYLVARCMMHDMKTRFKFPVGYDRRHVDMFELLGKDGGLGAWSDAILHEPHDQDGSDVAGMVEAGLWDDLSNYCMTDVRHTVALYERMQAVTNLEV